MKFLVERTRISEEKPCEEAVKREKVYTDDFGWYVNISSLEELIKFIDNANEEVIIKEVQEHNQKYYALEIYDCFRE